MVETINQYKALLALKNTILDKYSKMLDDRNNKIKSLESLLILRDQEISMLKKENILSKKPMEIWPSQSVVKIRKENLIDNEVISENNFVSPTDFWMFNKVNTDQGGDNNFSEISPVNFGNLWNQADDKKFIPQSTQVFKPQTNLLQKELSLIEDENDFLKNRKNILESWEKQSTAIETSEEPQITTEEVLRLEYTPMEKVLRHGNIEVVNSPYKDKLNILEDVKNPNFSSPNVFQGIIDFGTTSTKTEKLTTDLFERESNLENSINIECFIKEVTGSRQTGKLKPLPCHYKNCGKIFQDRRNYAKHMKGVHGPKMFLCSECQRGFRINSKLIRHMIVHTGKQHFSCPFDICEQRFSLEFNMKRHMKIHTGERPYRCNVVGCEKSFAQSSNMQSHALIHDKVYYS